MRADTRAHVCVCVRTVLGHGLREVTLQRHVQLLVACILHKQQSAA